MLNVRENFCRNEHGNAVGNYDIRVAVARGTKFRFKNRKEWAEYIFAIPEEQCLFFSDYMRYYGVNETWYAVFDEMPEPPKVKTPEYEGEIPSGTDLFMAAQAAMETIHTICVGELHVRVTRLTRDDIALAIGFPNGFETFYVNPKVGDNTLYDRKLKPITPERLTRRVRDVIMDIPVIRE